jgi:hypothetical protein
MVFMATAVLLGWYRAPQIGARAAVILDQHAGAEKPLRWAAHFCSFIFFLALYSAAKLARKISY